MTHKFPVNASEERMAHDVSETCLRVATQALLGILKDEADGEMRRARKGLGGVGRGWWGGPYSTTR